MISASAIRDIISVYVKHGWLLRRVLLSKELRSSVQLPDDLLPEANVVDSDIDALWFSRPPKIGGAPWEIRHLSPNPYALLFTIDERDGGLEDSLDSAENVLRANIAARKEA